MKEVPETNLRINTVCKLLLKFLILYDVDIQESSHEDNQKQPQKVSYKLTAVLGSLFLINLEG